VFTVTAVRKHFPVCQNTANSIFSYFMLHLLLLLLLLLKSVEFDDDVAPLY